MYVLSCYTVLLTVCTFHFVILQVLCIHIKRFYQSSSVCKKLTDYVEFPLCDLDMSSYLHLGILACLLFNIYLVIFMRKI